MTTKYTEVEINLDYFEDDELIEELEARGYKVRESANDMANKLYEAYALGNKELVNSLIEKFIYEEVGRIV
jgi:hypothetical protein